MEVRHVHGVPLLIAAALSVAGCATTRATALLAEARYVAVLPVTAAPRVVLRAPRDSTVDLLAGGPGPGEALREELAIGLEAAGFRVQPPPITRDRLAAAAAAAREGHPLPNDAAGLARLLGVDAVVTARVTEWDAGPLRLFGRMRIALALSVVHRDGRVLTAVETTRPVVGAKLYPERTAWRVHAREAVARLLRTLR